MRLSEFILTNEDSIIAEWIAFAGTLTPAASAMSRLQLQDHISQILDFIAKDIESDQSSAEQIKKSHGHSDQSVSRREDTASEIHGSIRHADGFDIVQMVSEYRALRASIIKLWTASKDSLSNKDLLDLTRMNESIDQSLAESVAKFMQKVAYSKDLLLGVLGHDIRSPLGAITMAANLMGRVGTLNEKQTQLQAQVSICGKRVADIVTDLLDLTRARLGSGLPIDQQTMSMDSVAHQIVDEMRIQHPERKFSVEISGDCNGKWDTIRVGQVFSNLIGNAVQYGLPDFPVSVKVAGQDKNVLITVHNKGDVIPPASLATLFDSFTRVNEHTSQATGNLGLGLFITKEIVRAHEGFIHVTSNETEGTSFIITMPRNSK